MNTLKRIIKGKADEADVFKLTGQNEKVIQDLDERFSQLADQVQLTLKQFGKISGRVEALSDINRDVLLGKRNANCISCNKGMEEKYESVKMVEGVDGRLYQSQGKGELIVNEGKITPGQADNQSMIEELIATETQWRNTQQDLERLSSAKLATQNFKSRYNASEHSLLKTDAKGFNRS